MENVYRIDEDELIKGIGLPAFIHNFDYHQVLIKIYEDGLIDCWGDLITFDEFKKKVDSGWVVTQLPKKAEVSCYHLYYEAHSFETYIDIKEFVKEVNDTICSLQGKKTSEDYCIKFFEKYLNDPSDANREALSIKYNDVPEHLRMYLLRDQDSKDYPIRDCIKNNLVDPEALEDYKRYYNNLFRSNAN